MHVVRTGSLTLPLAPDTALPYFTPEGESRWVPGWEPVAHHAPGDTLAHAGAVFSTAVGGETTLWLVLDFDRDRRHARYARITPGSRLGTVDVRCEPDGDGSRVHVTYELTSISTLGESVLEALTDEAYAEMLRDWEAKIRAIL